MVRDPSDTPPFRGDRFQLLVSSIVDYAIYMLDPQGFITTWNPGAERAKGYAPHEVIGQHFSMFFTPEDRAAGKPEAALSLARETGRWEDEGWRVRRDGGRYWVLAVLDAIRDENGTVIGFAKITRDMTERRAALEALVESERRFRLLVMSVVDYALFTLGPDGSVTNWNPGAERLKGYAADEIIGQHFSVFYTDEDRQTGLPSKALSIAASEGKFEAEGWRVRKDGKRFWASVVIDPMWGEGRELLGFAKITRDISDKRALEQAREQLHQAQKMKTVGQLTGGVAHDFNNLLTAVSGSLDLIQRYTTDARVQRLAQTALSAANRGSKLTSQLLAFARQQTLRPQVSNLNELISVFDILVRQAVGENIEVEFVLEPKLGLVEVDQAQFQSALLNLVVNARDAMNGTGGKLTVTTFNVRLDDARAANLGEILAGDYVGVEVRDTGHGMTPDVKARAVEPFFSTKEVGKGSGLGLSQVYGFVRQSEGQIEIQSEAGRGTTVRLYLPRVSGAAARKEEQAPDLPERKTSGTILVVEDDPDVLEIAVASLQTIGYHVISAPNAIEALRVLERDVPIDILFTDVIMPKGMNGVELAEKARMRRPDLRVLLTSGYAREVMQGQEIVGKHIGFIGKPYQFSELANALAAMMQGSSPSSAR